MRKNLSAFSLFIVAALALMVSACASGPSSAGSITVKSDVLIPSADGITVQGTLYMTAKLDAPFIVLCHRASWSRGEYVEIAPRLNELGFNCLAIDQRSGKERGDVLNATALLAASKSLPTAYVDALPDIKAAVEYARKQFRPKALILWGSSYSSALSIVAAAEMPEAIQALVLFSPGEYFAKQGKSATWITENSALVRCPVFITAAKKEAAQIEPFFKAFPAAGKTMFIPTVDGKHGSEALFYVTQGNEEYWKALTAFLAQF